MSSSESIAVAHKDYDVRGGGEKVVEYMAELLDCPLYPGRFDIEKYPTEKAIDVRPLFTKGWQKFLLGRGGLTRSVACRYLWQQDARELTQYDTLILSGNEPLWYVGPDDQTTIAYTHSTPRWLFDLFDEIENDAGSRLWKVILEQQRQQYHHHVCRPDLYVANSELVARRIEKYYGIPERDIKVVYPPVDVGEFSRKRAETGEYYIVVSRLASHKGLDWLIEQANELNLPLKIAGRGPERDRLEDLAGESVELLGYVSESKKAELLSGGKAFFMPAQNEDFGMTPIEAFASGTPVIGVNEGFTQYQVVESNNGYLFDRNAGDFKATVERFESDGVAWSEADIERFAQNFGVGRFEDELYDVVDEAKKRSSLEPDYNVIPGSEQ